MGAPAFAKIPARINTTDREAARLYAFYVCLKLAYYNGLIYNFKSRRQDIADTLGVHYNTVRAYEKMLVRKSWAHWDGKHLQLRSYKTVWHFLGINKAHIRFYKTTSFDYEYNKNLIDSVRVFEQIRKQQHTIKTKIVALEVNNVKACEQFNLPTCELIALVKKSNQRAKNEAAYYRLIKQLWKHQGDKLLKRYESAFFLAMHSGIESAPVTPWPVLSMAGLAYDVLGTENAPSSGASVKRRLEKFNLVTFQAYQVRVSRQVTNAARKYQPFGVCGKHRQLTTRVNIGN